eukprot:m.273980 g.273980  ORF g.273980 m.273980 type:complete len:446 (+) comp40581_c0_seq11:415-1752(+)
MDVTQIGVTDKRMGPGPGPRGKKRSGSRRRWMKENDGGEARGWEADWHPFFKVNSAVAKMNGSACADLLSAFDSHANNKRLQLENAESICSRWLDSPWNELVASHLRLCWAAAQDDSATCYACQTFIVQTFVRILQTHKESNWALPLMYVFIADLRTFANKADLVQIRSGLGKPGEMLEKAADSIMSCFRVCVSDNRSSLEVSKKWGTLPIVNNLFKIYFKTNKLHLCKPLIRAIESSNIKDNFPRSHTVTYRYYVGRKAMFDNDYKTAEEYLSYAFNHCYQSSRRNQRLVLVYLIPVKMMSGCLPTTELLDHHNLHQFSDVTQAVSQGNLRLLNDALREHEAFFIKFGIYLILEKLKIMIYRNLFKKVFLILNVHQLPLSAFVLSMQMVGEDDMDVDEVQCIVANLIDKGYIRGYISHQHKKLVVSKQNAFPKLPSADSKVSLA